MIISLMFDTENLMVNNTIEFYSVASLFIDFVTDEG